ncbi:MAG: hypothetical protein GWO04_42970, partial [Actinobacteria bacterium]|nr:hypothetical protein [Actinomycetota bacterium]
MARSSDLDAVLGATAPSDAALSDAWDTFTPLRDWLGDPMNMEIAESE